MRLFNNLLGRICNQAIPKRRLANRTVPWWNEELSTLRKKANKIKKQMIRARKLQLMDKKNYVRGYKDARNKYVSQIKKEKTEAWKNFVTTTGNQDPWSIVYKIVCNKIKQPNQIGSLTLPTGQQTSSWGEPIEALLNKYVPKDDKDIERDNHSLRTENKRYINYNLEPDISRDEIAYAIGKLKRIKRPALTVSKVK